MGWSATVFCLFDFLRLWKSATRPGAGSVATDFVNVAFVVVGIVLTEVWGADPLTILASWSLGLTIGVGILLSSIRSGLRLGVRGIFDSHAFTFGLQGLLGSGSVQIANFLIGAVQSTQILGALRGGTTFSGPSNLVTSTVQSAAIRPFAKTTPGSKERNSSLLKWLLVSSSTSIPVLVVAGLVAYLYGGELLGETWVVTAPVLIWILADAAMVSFSGPAHAAHRADLKSRRVLAISITVGLLRMSLVPFGAVVAGATGAAIIFFGLSMVSGLLLWASYFHYARAVPRGRHSL
ncbi:oligosaccharide flippase family protein [Citricoccus nitrophenolicus]